jgi:hypothetical protein
MRGTGFTALLAALLALVMASTALAGPLDDFRRNGTINPCRYSDRQLRDGLNGLPPDVQQYAPGLADQLSAGREGCGGGGGDNRITTVVPGPGAPTGGGTVGPAPIPKPPAPKPTRSVALAGASDVKPVALAQTGSDVPGWLTPILIGFLVAGAGALGLYLSGRRPDKLTRPLKASVGDAEGRVSDALAQLRDTFRFGR